MKGFNDLAKYLNKTVKEIDKLRNELTDRTEGNARLESDNGSWGDDSTLVIPRFFYSFSIGIDPLYGKPPQCSNEEYKEKISKVQKDVLEERDIIKKIKRLF